MNLSQKHCSIMKLTLVTMTNYNTEKIIPEEQAGKRLDVVLANIFPEFSRSRLKNWIIDGFILVDGKVLRPRDFVTGGELVSIEVILDESIENEAESIKFNIEYEDDEIIVINKPVGLVVHPGAGNPNGTLLNGLIHQWPKLREVPRAGIIHRLDKDTSGLMIIAKNIQAHNHLVQQLSNREISREYEAICCGVLTGGGVIDKPIGRHHKNRTKMAVREDGKRAITNYRVIKRFRAHTHIKVNLETGRTHQIRVHFAFKKNALLGDPTYARLKIPSGCTENLESKIRDFRRQALCATKLELRHPTSSEKIIIKAEIASDLIDLLGALKKDNLNNE